MITNTKKIGLLGLLMALCVVGSYIKIPAITGTPALDAAPAFIAGAILSPLWAALVGFAGHLLTALNAGMPLGLGLHLLIAGEMAIIVLIFSLLYRQNKILAYLVALFLNGIVSPASFIPILGSGFFYAMVFPLLIASGVNLFVTSVSVQAIEKASSLVHE